MADHDGGDPIVRRSDLIFDPIWRSDLGPLITPPSPLVIPESGSVFDFDGNDFIGNLLSSF